MKAARVVEPGKIVIEEVPIPRLGENDVLIKVHRVGICGTDVGVKNGYITAKFPVTLGHEFSGTVAKLGAPSLGGFMEGMPVSAAGGWGCRKCELCQNGMALYCKNRISLGRTVDGCMAEFVKVDYREVYRLPSNVSFDEGQNVANIACVVRAFKKVPLQLGKTVAIFGPGNAGLIMLQMCKLAGAYQGVMVGTRDFRLEMARKFGANHVINVKRDNPVKAILGWYPNGVDVAVEAAGTESSLQSCCDVIRPAGVLVVFGIFHGKLREFDPCFLYYKEPLIYGSKGADGAYQEAIQLLEEKRLQIETMITHRFPLVETPEAFRIFEDKIPDALRIVIEP
jgi:threonine dehydrogenase-like Zn-dependent dehydrogenase